MKMYETTQPVVNYLNVKLECDCGRVHYAPIKAVNISKGAINSVVDYAEQYHYKKPYILCDKITYEIAGKKCEQMFRDKGYDAAVLIIRHMGFDEATLGEIVINKPQDCDVMIGVGTGSITDILRYSSYKLKLPCFTIATGAPMDGFSASAGIMNVNNMKATMEAHSTEVIIGDTDILTGAPYRMTIAGFADLIAKLNALNDWKLGTIINGDHFCRNVYTMVDDYVHDILEKRAALKARQPEAVGDVMNALLLTGASISLYGNSRPISGAEHHMSHYWEIVGDQRGKPFAMHGEQVAVGTVLALRVNEELSKRMPDFDKAREIAKNYDPEAWKAEIQRVYGNAAEAIIELEAGSDKNGAEKKLERLDVIESKWEELSAIMAGVYSSELLREQLAELGCPCSPKDIGISAQLLKDTLLYCKETRARYTVFQLACDLGLMDEIADTIVEELQERELI